VIASALLSIGVLICVGALLHLVWVLARAALVWAPSGYVGIVSGLHVAQCTESAAFGVAMAIGAAALVRFAIVALWVRLFTRRCLVLVAWAEAC
jgi:hypothetical protein